MKNTRIRPAETKDAGAVLRLIKDLAAQHDASQMIVWTETDLAEILSDIRSPFDAFVAEDTDTGVVIGCALYFERVSSWKGPTLHIEDLIVRPEYRGGRIGEALMDAVIDRARDKGIDRVELDVERDNQAALRFYRRKGFDTDSWQAAKFYLDPIR